MRSAGNLKAKKKVILKSKEAEGSYPEVSGEVSGTENHEVGDAERASHAHKVLQNVRLLLLMQRSNSETISFNEQKQLFAGLENGLSSVVLLGYRQHCPRRA